MQTARIQYNFCLYTSRPTFFPREVCSLPHSLFHSFIHPSIHPSIWEHVHSLSLVLSLPSSIHTIFAERDRAWLSPASLQDPAGSSEPEIDHAPVTRVALHCTALRDRRALFRVIFSILSNIELLWDISDYIATFPWSFPEYWRVPSGFREFVGNDNRILWISRGRMHFAIALWFINDYRIILRRSDRLDRRLFIYS